MKLNIYIKNDNFLSNSFTLCVVIKRILTAETFRNNLYYI